MDCPEAGGILTCELEGYRVHSIAVFDTQASQEILLHRSSGGHLEGLLITTDGEPLHESLELHFRDTSGSLTQKRIVTNDDGTFAFDIDAPRVQALCLTPGWYLPFEGVHPQHRQKWAFPTLFFPGREEEAILIVAAPEPEALTVLKVTDAVSGDPIESFSMFLRGLDHRMPLMADRYFAPKGELVLVGGAEPYPSWTKHVELHVWADGHAPSTREIPDITAAGVIELELQPTKQSPLEGRITRSAVPVEGAAVSLSCFYALQWDPGSLGKLVATRSASDGSFQISAPTGEYILRVEHEGADLYQHVVLPGPPLQIDLDHLGSLELVVVDEDSVPQPSHRVSVRDSSGRQMMGDTDETGSVIFSGLAPGRYTANALYEVTRFVLKPHDTHEVDLGPGANQRVELQVPVDHGAVFARVVSEGVDRFDDWKVRATYSENRDWQAIEASGQIPIDVKNGAMSLLIEEPRGQRWKISIPAAPGPDYTVRLDRGGPGFEGVLLDRSSGTPVTGFRIGVGVRGQGNAITTTTTDDRGHFRLLGVPSGEAYFVFGDRAASETPSSDQWIRFDARAPSNEPPTQLTLHLPHLDGSAYRGIENRPVTGRVLSKSTGEPVTDAKLFLEAVFEEPSGTFFLKLPSSEPSTNSEGIYRATLPVATEYRGMVVRLSAMGTSTTDRWSAPPSTGEVVHDFRLEE
ncbi:MAG: carboxypeptidase-like regulatory domain-containing protein [Planctomycetota bacterium]